MISTQIWLFCVGVFRKFGGAGDPLLKWQGHDWPCKTCLFHKLVTMPNLVILGQTV